MSIFILPAVACIILNSMQHKAQNNARKRIFYLLKLWVFIYVLGIVSSVVGFFGEDTHFNINKLKSSIKEMQTDSYTGLLFVFLWMYIVVLTVSSATIFLNLIRKIRNNFLWRFLSFFLLPSAVLYIDLVERKGNEFDIVLYPTAIPFWITLTLTFIAFSLCYKKYWKD